MREGMRLLSAIVLYTVCDTIVDEEIYAGQKFKHIIHTGEFEHWCYSVINCINDRADGYLIYTRPTDSLIITKMWLGLVTYS